MVTTTKRVRLKKDKTDYETIVCIVESLLVDFPGYTRKELERDCREVQQRLSYEGLSFATMTLPNIGKGLLAYLETGSGNYSGFKICKHGYPSFLKGLFRHVYDSSSVNHVLAVKVVYQISEAFKKLRGPFDQDKLMKQLNDFISVDAELPDIERGDEVLHYARYLITEVFKNFEDGIVNITPRPGPGATNTPLPQNLRFRPNKVFRKVDDFFPYGEYFYSTFYEFCSDRVRLKKLYNEMSDEQTARFKFVPKKVGTARGICIEENDVQYLQQGVSKFIRSCISKSSLCKDSIHFSEQYFNAHIALLSSSSGLNSTLDMKEASDRISRSLVIYLFSKLPLLLSALLSLSTEVVDLTTAIDEAEKNGFGSVRIKKFAPMGSALCFPIMSVVHWALVTAVAKVKCKLDPHSYRLLVYGDDITLPSSIAPEVMNSLPVYGLKFNTSKSFWRGGFRESCGIHAYKGVNITPIFFKHLPKRDIEPTAMSSVIANEQLAFQSGYNALTSCIRSAYELPYVHTTSNVVGWKRPDAAYVNLNAKRKYDEQLQRFVYRCQVFRSLKEGINPAMPRHNLITVLTQSQIKALKLGSNWSEHDAYLRALLLNCTDHDRYWAFDKLAYHFRWL